MNNFKGKNNPMYGKTHTKLAKKKISIANKGKRNGQYGKRGKRSPNFGNVPTDKTRKKMSDARKGTSFTERHRKNIGKKLTGNKNALGYRHTKEESVRRTNENKRRWSSNRFRIKTVRAVMKGCKLKPNKPEKVIVNLLKKILPNEYRYVGNGRIILDGFNPDFVNKKQTKIIELYGNYWHSKPLIRERDKRRLKAYKKYGYQTLIIWERELKDTSRVAIKIRNFSNKK